MQVGVVGAGIAGLAAARHLKHKGVDVTVFEAESHVGGRCCSVSIGQYTFDPGASSTVPRGHSIENVILRELDTTDLVKIELPVYTHDGKRFVLGTGLPPTSRYCYSKGMRVLANLLAEGLSVETGSRVETLEDTQDGRYTFRGRSFDAVVLAVPFPEARRLLSQVGDKRQANNTRYRSCLSVLLGFSKPTATKFHAVVAEESVYPLHWLSIESQKVPGRAPDGHTALVAQLGPKYSKWNMDASDQSILEDTLVDIARVLGAGFESPVVQQVVRWQVSQPDSVSSFSSVNPPGTKLIVAGDGLAGGRIEHAFDSGIEAATMLVGL